jgi:hypothetical protein
VTFQSASALCTKALDPSDADHISIVKPVDQNADAYLSFKGAYRREMATLRPTAAVIQQFEGILNVLHQTQMRKNEDLFPQLDNYFRDPSEGNWRTVQSTARELINEIDRAVAASMAFDAQFYEQGQNVVLIANGTRAVVDRTYNQPFRTSRREWNGKEFVLKEIIQSENRPTPEQARAWAQDLKQRYDRLTDEISRLLDVIRQRT